MKNIYLFVLLFMMFILVGCNESNTIEKIDVRAQLLRDGDLYIEELYTYNKPINKGSLERNLELFDYQTVEFFEAYIPPKMKSLGQFTHEELERVHVANNDRTYRPIFAKVNDDKTVYYRYRIDKAASKFSDTGELNWNIFASIQHDLHQVKIDVIFPQQIAENEVTIFSYNKNGGKSEVFDNRITYQTDFISHTDTFKQTVFFPAHFLSEMEEEKSTLTLADRIEQEKNMEEMLVRKDLRLQNIEKGLSIISWILVGTCAIFLIPLKMIAAKWVSRKIPMAEVEKYNPVYLLLLYRKGTLQIKDFIAGIFSIQHKGLLKIEKVSASYRFQKEEKAPKQTLAFKYLGKRRTIKESDLFLLNWLFRHNTDGYRTFILDSIAGPTKAERKQKKYRRKLESFLIEWKVWKEVVDKEFQLANIFKKGMLMRKIYPVLWGLHVLLILLMFLADAKTWQVILFASICLGVGIFYCYKHIEKKWVQLVYFAGCLFIGMQVNDTAVNTSYLLIVILTGIIVLVTPRTTLFFKAAVLREAVKKWRKLLKSGGMPIQNSKVQLVGISQHAILLGVGKQFFTRFHQKFPNEQTDNIVLFDHHVIDMITYVTNSLKPSYVNRPRPHSGDSGGGTSGDSGGGFFEIFSSGDSGDSSGDGGGGGD
ncbi:DUF2207 domain-containing protein [Metabacillus malikii]|uniref:DUF2207 domain-containing protein n=1 Tax=Metabacillus malikii TaxID=1504265 RepID=A0ABT9ZCB2_9BACI|nr:DUF2207 domain-containing protein [Metabacillus malikii]MDQ0229891.1 hypothetical protein [Metabacillus malikii]